MKKISKRDANLILIVTGAIIFVLALVFVYSDFNDRADLLDRESEGLRIRLSELKALEADVPMYNEKIREYAELSAQELSNYAQFVRTEDLIMYAVMLEDEMQLDISSASFTDPTLISEFSLPSEDGPVDYSAYSVSMTINTRMSYADMKDAITRVYATQDRTLLESLAIVFNSETGGLSGTITLSKVFILGGPYTYTPTRVPDGPLGKPNPFGTIDLPTALATETELQP